MRSDKRLYSQLALLRMIADSIWLTGTQPSMRELADAMGWTSASYVHVLLRKLKEEGVIDFDTKKRAIKFDWKNYVSDRALSRNEIRLPRFDPPVRLASKRRAKQGAAS